MSHGFLADEFYHCPRVASFGAVSSNVPCTVAELGRMGMNREYRLSTSGVDPLLTVASGGTRFDPTSRGPAIARTDRQERRDSPNAIHAGVLVRWSAR